MPSDFSSKLRKTSSSLKTSVWLLAAMCVFFILGTIFPQGTELKDYMEAGGKFVPFVKWFNLLGIFTSPLFLILSGLLSVNLLVCIYDRWRAMKKRPAYIPEGQFFMNPKVVEMAAPEDALLLRAKEMRFKEKYSAEGIHVLEKGLPFRWLSWIYHLGIVVAILGFLSTALFAFEEEITLYKGKPVKISLYSPDTRWNKFKKALGMSPPEEKKEKEYEAALLAFETEYTEALKVDYPKEPLTRLALGLGFRPLMGEGKPEVSYSPKMWLSRISLKTPREKAVKGALWVNRPYRFRGLTLYQMGFEQDITLLVDGKPLKIKSMEPFEIKGMEGKFITGMAKTGKVYKKDGMVEKFTPFFELKHTGKDGRKKELGKLVQGKPERFLGKRFLFKGMEEASGLSYRIDPGVTFISISVWLLFAGLLLRSLGYWGRIQIVVKEGKTYALLSTRGLLANGEKIMAKLKGE